MAVHPAGDITPAAACSLLKAFRVLLCSTHPEAAPLRGVFHRLST